MIVLGLMSGTAADGIDAVIARIEGTPADLSIEQIAFETLPWPDNERSLIFRLFEGNAPTALICRANFMLAERFAAAALEAITNAGIQPADVDLIGSHGQTLWHDVDAATGNVTSTLQISDPSVIAARTGITTVGNFRTADVAAGGQGAPLVSIFDWLLLRPPPNLNGVAQGWRAVQNIGGIGNVTFLPPTDVDALPLAFDTGPGNALIDWAVTQITDGKQFFDDNGRLARQGSVNFSLLETWLEHDYYGQKPPKTTGRELFSVAYAETLRQEANEHGLSDADFIATLTALTATSIAQAYYDFAPGPLAQVAVAGGGANNPTLMQLISEQSRNVFGKPVEVINHEPLSIDGDAKEALTFGLLAYLAIHGWAGNVPACTGARSEQILGQIAPGKNWKQFNTNPLSTE